LALREEIHLAVVDVAMPGLTGLCVARELRDRRPDLRVVMVSMHDNEQSLFEALKAGAPG
jgi:DNA-binding NarL/FixJ family response regulator